MCIRDRLPTHLMNHEVKKKLTNGRHRVIYHAHTTNTIALTFVLPLDDKVFTRELWESATECPVVFPDGVGAVSYTHLTPELKKAGNKLVWLRAPKDQYDLPDYAAIMDQYEKLHNDMQAGKVVSAYALDRHGIAAAVSKMRCV